jgi:spermidine synthase
MNGLHVIGDFSGCRCDPQRLLDGAAFERKCAELAQAAGFAVTDVRLGRREGAGYAGMVMLGESHVAVRTWPESAGLTLDVYLCSSAADSRDRARRMFDSMTTWFDPAEAAATELDRGQHLIMEPLNDSTGFYIRAQKKLGEWQTKHQTMEVFETPQYGRIVRSDGRNMTSEREEFVCHENLVHPALTAHAAPRKVLIIGGGDGGAAEEALKHPSVDQVTICEIDAEVIRLAKEHLFAVHRGAFDNPRLRAVVGEGMKFIRETHERFDLIALDLDNPMGSAEALCSTEFFQHCRHALAVGGALALHIGAPMARPERLAELAQRLNGVFRIVRPYTMYIPLYGTQWAMAVCSDKLDPKSYTADEIDRRIEARHLADLRFYNGETHEGVFALPNFIRDLVNPPRLKLQTRGRRLGVVRAAAK